MKREYLFALVFPRERLLSLEQIQELRSQAHAEADRPIDNLCALALDGSVDARRELSVWARTELRATKE